MTDTECTAFLQWALPRLGRRWAGYRKVRGLVCKRLARRLRMLGLPDLDGYRRLLESQPEQWPTLDALCGIPISRFYRDRAVFESLEQDVLPALAATARVEGRDVLRCWSGGCASGEEPHTVAIVWRERLQPEFPQLDLRILASDSDPALIERARVGCYASSSLKELPADLRAAAFVQHDWRWCVRPQYRAVVFACQDLREAMPAGPFDLVLCRNVVATYYSPDIQREIMRRIADRMRPGSALVLGIHEPLVEDCGAFAVWPGARAVFRKLAP